jgi:hypothetical protein
VNETTTPPTSDQASQNPPDAAKAPNKKRWGRIAWIILGAIVLLWGSALVFFKAPIRANVWAWRLESADQADRERFVYSLVTLGEPAIGPAIRLTRSDKPEVRERGVEVLLGMLRQQLRERADRVQTEAKGKVVRVTLAEGPMQVDPRIAERFTQLLDDPAPAVQAQAIEGVTLGHIEGSANTLARLAIQATDPLVASAATLAIDRVASGPAAEAMLRKILADAAGPEARAQAIASLGMYPSAETQRAIAMALPDDRRVRVPPESILFDPRLAGQLAAQMAHLRGRAATQPQSQADEPAEPNPVTVGDYAARMLEFLTGKSLGMLSSRPAEERTRIIEQYRLVVDRAASRPD